MTTKVACRLWAREAIPHTTLDRRTGRGRYVTKAAPYQRLRTRATAKSR